MYYTKQKKLLYEAFYVAVEDDDDDYDDELWTSKVLLLKSPALALCFYANLALVFAIGSLF